MSKTDKIIAYIMQQLNLIGENFGWQIGKVGANYENGYMKCNQDSKAHFRKEKIRRDIEQMLSEEHIPGVTKKVETNADKIRGMSDEELADKIFAMDEPLKFVLPFCENSKNNEKCNEILDSGELIPDEMCKQCLLEWLKKKVE